MTDIIDMIHLIHYHTLYDQYHKTHLKINAYTKTIHPNPKQK